MSKWSTRQIATAAIIAALYTVMSLLSSIFGLTYGPIQCRFSEALTVLPFFLPEAVPGLFVGCLVTNLMSTVGPLDIIFGSMATLLAATTHAPIMSTLMVCEMTGEYRLLPGLLIACVLASVLSRTLRQDSIYRQHAAEH